MSRITRGKIALKRTVLDVRQLVSDAVSALSPRCRQMVQMLFFEDAPRPYRDVAAELGVAVGSIGFLRSRCLDTLRAALERIGL